MSGFLSACSTPKRQEGSINQGRGDLENRKIFKTKKIELS